MILSGSSLPNASLFTRLVWWCIAICAVLLTLLLEWPLRGNFAPPGDEWLRDRFINWHASDSPETRIAMVDIDESSLVALGPWPWPRARIASLVERLISDYGARGVALDLYFSEPADAEGDQRLAVLGEHAPVVLAQVFDYEHKPIRIGHLIGGIPDAATLLGLPSNQVIPMASGFIGNHQGLLQARHVGNIGFVPDQDGVLRHLPLYTRFEHQLYPTLSLALLNCCVHSLGTVTATQKTLTLPVPTFNQAGFLRIPYRHTLAAFHVSKATDIFNQRTPFDAINNKLVIIGSSSLNLSDRVATPLSPSTSGFLVHASTLSGLLDQQEGGAPAAWPGHWLAIAYCALVAGLAIYLFPRFSALSNTIFLFASSLLWLFFAYFITPHDDLFVAVAPLYSNLLLLTTAVPFGWQITQSRSKKLLGTLHQYVAKAVVDELLSSDLKDPLAPRQLHVTTLIADMEAYTSHVEKLPIQAAANLTREFLACLAAPVLELGGTLDKFTGDGLVAFWGAPLPVHNHADLALDAAEKILNNIADFNLQREAQGLEKIRVRIGIESGIAMAGDFGTSTRSIYTAVGDSVNVASRLEDIARHYPVDLIVGQGTVDSAQHHQFGLLGERQLKGKEHVSRLYTLQHLIKPHSIRALASEKPSC